MYVRTMTSPPALPPNQRCLMLPILHPTILSMTSPTSHSPMYSPETASSTMCHLLFSFPHPHDRPRRTVRRTLRVSRLDWRTPYGKSYQLPWKSTKSRVMIGKTMRCSSAMVQPVCHLDAPEFVPINTGCPGNRTERCLSYDEKPLLLFQKLKDASKNPVFMLKHQRYPVSDRRCPTKTCCAQGL